MHRKEVVLHSRAIGVVTVMARAEPEADCRMVLETRHDYGDLDADENDCEGERTGRGGGAQL